MGSPVVNELECLYQHAVGSRFIIEVGSGKSTKIFFKAVDNGIVYSIDIKLPVKSQIIKGIKYLEGWSVKYSDLIKPGDPDFVMSRYRNTLDEKVVVKGNKYMRGEVNLIRKIVKKNSDKQLDFFFCDTGEYCGLAEWNVVKNILVVGGKFAIHDIYYPKSIKGYKVVERIKQSDDWKVLDEIKTTKGLLVAKKI